MLNTIFMVILLFIVTFLETGISLTEPIEQLLYVHEDADKEEVTATESKLPNMSVDFKAATTDEITDADRMLERIYGDGK